MHILFFAQVKDAAGLAEWDLAVTGEPTPGELWDQLIAARPELAVFQKTTRLARNGEYAAATTRFTDADEVALIPPVSGG
jgi:molybdopterin converting factor subunit 1